MPALLPARRPTRHAGFGGGSPPPGQGAGPNRRAGSPHRGTHGARRPGRPARCEPRDLLANPIPEPPKPMSHATEPRPSAGRVVAVVSGAVAGLVAFGLVVVGAVLLYANGQKDHDGYVSTGSDRFHTRTYALATDDLDVNTDAPDWVDTGAALGHIRLKATSRAGKPVFVGIAPTKDVHAYLRGTSHATVTDVDYEPFHATDRTRGGS